MKYTIVYTLCFLLCASFLPAQENGNQSVRIGLVADIQYADKNTAGSRHYRASLSKVSNMVSDFENEELEFIVDLGDRIDKDFESFVPVEQILNTSKHPVIFVPGNHDFSVADKYKKLIPIKTGYKSGYHSKTINNWHFIFLNGLANSMIAHPKYSIKYHLAKKDLKKLKESGASNAYNWNGGLGKKQTKWMNDEMEKAAANGLNLMIFIHQPIEGDNAHNLWKAESIRETLSKYPNEIWWISGHDHRGGFLTEDNIHMLIMKGMVEGDNPSYGILELQGDSVRLIGFGDQPNL